MRAWRDDPSAATEEKAPKEKPALEGAAEGPPPEQVVLLGVGADLETAGAAGGEQGDGVDVTGGAELVHLRDGRQLREYGLQQASVVYVVLEGPRG